ncbi:MAG: transglycosylase SLT domain-containing protein [Rubrivivax sp.]|jgi:membrane-bound lytic murein transglycosylase D|nr:transglycosylase SLT domain-containing protein [Rubrivivax sp.]
MEEPVLSRGPGAWRGVRIAAGLVAALLLAGCAGLGTLAPPAASTASVPPVATSAMPAPEPQAAAAPSSSPDDAPARAAEAFAAQVRLEDALAFERTDLWQRVRDGLVLPDLDGALVERWEQWYATRPDYVRRMTERGGRYLFHIVEEVQRRGMPMEIALLPFIESAFNPQALSVARAAGIWQFMPATGKDFDLTQNLFRDERRDVLASTDAALDYLQLLHRQFGDWQLALAAYNWGQGNVQRAIERNRRAGRPTDYASLRMPDETRNYVPKLQAVENIVRQPEAFGLQLAVLENHPFFLSVPIERDIDVVVAARLAGVSVDEFRQLNPQHNKPVILAAGTPQVLLPYDNANAFLRNLDTHDGPLASWTAWVAPTALRASDAAQRLGIEETLLREVNRIPPRMKIQAGSTLLVPRAAHVDDDVDVRIADHARIAFAPETPALKRVVFRAGKKGDTVKAVARRYRVSATSVARWNDVGVRSRFAPGDSIVVMVPRAPAAKGQAGRRATAAKPAAPRQASAQRQARPATDRRPARVAQR